MQIISILIAKWQKGTKRMDDYILSVTDNAISIPQNLPRGHYRLVEITACEEEKDDKLHAWQDIENYIGVTNKNDLTTLSRIKNAVRRKGYNNVEDLKNLTTSDILKIRHIGKWGCALIIAICEIFSVDIEQVNLSYEVLIDYYRNTGIFRKPP